MQNPFRYGEIVSGSNFAGREREQAELAADIRNGQNVLLMSPRRYGKTSLVLATLEAMSRDVPSAYVDILRVPSYERLVDVLGSAVARLLGPLGRKLGAVAEIFRDIPFRPKLAFDSQGKISVEFTAGSSRPDVDRTIERLLELPGEIAERRGTRVALVLDEFQAFAELAPHMLGPMRAIFQRQSDVAHVFLGSRRHLLVQLFEEQTQPMFRMAKPILLGPIPEAEFRPFIRRRFASTKTPIAAEAIDRVLELTGGHPHDTQELCYFVWAIGVAASVFPLQPAAVERALEQLLDAEHARFTALWESLAPPQRVLLVALAAEPNIGIYGAQYRGRHRLPGPSILQRAAGRLVELDLIEVLPGREATYRIADTFLPLWLRRIGVV